MILLILPLAVVWGIGAAMKAPRQQRFIMMGLVVVGWAALQVMLPGGHPARVRADDLTRSVVIAVFITGLVLAYRQFFKRVRAEADEVEAARDAPAQSGTFRAAELTRYARHMILREIGGPGQKALREARVLVIGAGGLGSPVLQYLAAAGVGTIGVIDDDEVEASNLQRQTIHPDRMIGAPKVHSATEAIRAQNPFVEVRPYNRRLTRDIAPELFAEYDLVLDGCDDFATRYLVNEVCAAGGIPLVAAALTQWEGQISVWDPARDAPCYACVFPQAPAPGLSATCAEAGVLGPLPGILGAMMAAEAVKVIAQAGEPLRGRLLIYDALYAETRTIKAKRSPDCAVCAGLHPRQA